MPSIEEVLGAKSELAATLAAGLSQISNAQTVVFTMYVRVVLPMDGFVFWVRADLVSATQLKNATGLDVAPNATTTVQGSLHYTSDEHQNDDETITVNRVVFTAPRPVEAMNLVNGQVMFLGEFEGIRFAFSRRDAFFKQADLHHYVGDAVYPTMEPQIIDHIETFQSSEIVVSNSLPVWLHLANGLGAPIFPAHLVPRNLRPPYMSVDIAPESLRSFQMAPHVALDGTMTQLVAENVRITMYGMRNNDALDFQRRVNEFSVATDLIGIMNMPVVRDEKRTQVELGVVAMKKSIEFEVSYYQARLRGLALQLITAATPTFSPPQPPVSMRRVPGVTIAGTY
ncbi:MAG TPA: hypothetical protein VGC09_00470 [Rhodopila sp.]